MLVRLSSLLKPYSRSVTTVMGSANSVGSEAITLVTEPGFDGVRIDNDKRGVFFKEDASITWNRQRLEKFLSRTYPLRKADICGSEAIAQLFQPYTFHIALVIPTTAQPSHDWAARDPKTDFTINANGTHNLSKATRYFDPEGLFIFTSTNGATPNHLPLIELDSSWKIAPHRTRTWRMAGDMSIDQALHSFLGASKVAADVLVQAYGRYLARRTTWFRGKCLRNPGSGTPLHRFLADSIECAVTAKPYTVYGYRGKQVRDNIPSTDLIKAFYEFFKVLQVAQVYNTRSRCYSNGSMLKAIDICQKLVRRTLKWNYSDRKRIADLIGWMSDNSQFANHYPNGKLRYKVTQILPEI